MLFFLFLAHLSHRLKVNFHRMSVGSKYVYQYMEPANILGRAKKYELNSFNKAIKLHGKQIITYLFHFVEVIIFISNYHSS